MNPAEFASHDGVGLAELVRRREVSAEELRETALAAIAAVDSRVNSVVEVWEDEPVHAPEPDGDVPFIGVPFLVKDLAIAAKGRRSEAGSRFAVGVTADSDSELMRRFRAAGMTPVGRTATPEMAISTTTEPVANGPTRNPWDLDRNPGGSSGGSAAAVAAGLVPIAHGTDAGGSLRVPAASVGAFALKPSRGRVPNGPGMDEIWSGMGVQFVLTRSVRDSAVLLDALAGPEIGDPFAIPPPERPYAEEAGRDPKPLRIALMLDPSNGKPTDPAIRDAVEAVARLCSDLGHRVEEAAPGLGVSWEQFVLAYARIEAANTIAPLDEIARRTGRTLGPDAVEPATWAIATYGRSVGAEDLLAAFDVRNTVTRRVGTFLSRFDALLSPTLAEFPLPIGAYNRPQAELDGLGWVKYVSDRTPFPLLANFAGIPSMSMPLSWDAASGLPVGSQFTAGFGREGALLALAGQLERAAPWSGRRPPTWVGSDRDRTASGGDSVPTAERRSGSRRDGSSASGRTRT